MPLTVPFGTVTLAVFWIFQSLLDAAAVPAGTRTVTSATTVPVSKAMPRLPCQPARAHADMNISPPREVAARLPGHAAPWSKCTEISRSAVGVPRWGTRCGQGAKS